MRKLGAFIAAATLMALTTVEASAAGGSTSFTTTAGTGLTLNSGAVPGSFGSITLNGQVQTLFTTLSSYTASDSTGTGSGWNITFQATQFACTVGTGTNKCPTGGNSLPAGSLLMAPPTVACDASSSCGGLAAAPTISISSNTGIDAASAVKVASAAASTGMGTYDFTTGLVDATAGHDLKLTVPSSVYAGTTYNSTLTVSIGTSP